MTKNEKTPHGIVARLFFSTYFSPVVLWIGWGLLSGSWRGASSFNFILTVWMILLFPSGLFGFTGSGNVGLLAVLGYIAYTVIFILAFALRRRWQTCVLWIALLGFLVLNFVGCHIVAENATRGMTLP